MEPASHFPRNSLVRYHTLASDPFHVVYDLRPTRGHEYTGPASIQPLPTILAGGPKMQARKDTFEYTSTWGGCRKTGKFIWQTSGRIEGGQGGRWDRYMLSIFYMYFVDFFFRAKKNVISPFSITANIVSNVFWHWEKHPLHCHFNWCWFHNVRTFWVRNAAKTRVRPSQAYVI